MSIIFNEEIIDLAKKAAISMIKNEQETQKIEFGNSAGELWISKNQNQVVSEKTITVKGQEFFIGFFQS